MHFQYVPYMWIPVASAVITAALGMYAWRYRSVSGAAPFAVLMVLVTAWSLANGLELVSADLSTKLFWADFQYICYAAAAPIAWLALTLQYIGRGAWLTRRKLIGLGAVSALVAALIWITSYHSLLLYNATLDLTGPFPVASRTCETSFWIPCIYSYLLFSMTIYLLLRTLHRLSFPYRGQVLVLLIGLLIPLTSVGLYNLGLSPIPGYNISSALMSLSGLIVAWGLFRYRLFDIAPVARSTVIDGMDDGVIVLDTRQRIVDINPTARSILRRQRLTRSADLAIGDEASQAFCDWADLLQLAQNPAITHLESSVGDGDEACTYELRVSPLTDQHSRLLGQVITLRDITERIHTDALLVHQQQALAVMHDRERLARELHDGLAQDLAGLRLRLSVWHKLAETDLPKLHAELDSVREQLSHSINEVRRTIYALRPLPLDEMGFLPALRQFVDEFGGQTQLHIDLTVKGEPENLPALLELIVFRIVQESLNNVGKHARAREVHIELDLQVQDHLTLTICDDGQGFDPAILTEAAAYGHLGLTQMRDRVRDLRGQFTLDSQPGRGTEIRVVLPLLGQASVA